MTRAARALLAVSPLLWLFAPLRQAVEGRMALHMLVQLPLLLAAGWAAAAWWPRRPAAWAMRFDAQGLASATFASAVLAFWMIPAALDAALLAPSFAALKFLSWWLAGLLLPGVHRRIGAVPASFFLGNAAWMLATAGLLYREAEQRLCVSYLVDEQAATGTGLIAFGLASGALALHAAATSGSHQAGGVPSGRGG